MIRPAPIEVRAVSKGYGTRRALEHLALRLPPGQIVGPLGENGCGKTTLLKILAGALAEYRGEVAIAGRAPASESKARVSVPTAASISPDGATVTECVMLYSDFFAAFDAGKTTDLIEHFALEQVMKLKQMSKGMRAKVQIALAMTRRADVYLLDEPIAGGGSSGPAGDPRRRCICEVGEGAPRLNPVLWVRSVRG